MTFKEKFDLEEANKNGFKDNCTCYCPCEFGYEKDDSCCYMFSECDECWNREMVEEDNKEREGSMDFKFKVGDKVRIKTLEQIKEEFGENFNDLENKKRKIPCMTDTMSKLCGKEMTISAQTRKFEGELCYNLKGESWNWGEWMLEEFVPDFKVGDRIICTQEDNVSSIPCYEVGAIGTIIENEYNDSRSMAVEFETLDLIESCGDNMWFVKLEDMELYDTPKASLKFKVGDRIICINNDDSGFYDKGAIGTVVSFEGERDGYRVKFETLDLIDDCSDTWCVLEGDMELYKENKEDSAYELIFRRQ